VGIDPRLVERADERAAAASMSSSALPSAGIPLVSNAGTLPRPVQVEPQQVPSPQASVVNRPGAALPRRNAAPGASASTPTASGPAPAPSAQCDPPYLVDGRGVKRFKRECVR
jgi:serine/threonine-protein kinase